MIERADTLTETQPIASSGFRPKGRYRRVECDWIEAEEGSPKLWAEIRSDLPFGVIDDLPAYNSDLLYREIWAIIAPHIRDWNCTAPDVNTGEWADVPPPAEIGVDAFKYVDPRIADWLFIELKLTYQRAIADPKAPDTSEPSEPTDDPPNAPAPASSSPAKKSPKNRRDSGLSSPGT